MTFNLSKLGGAGRLGKNRVVCRLCEEEVFENALASHTSFCELAHKSDYVAGTVDQKIGLVVEALQELLASQEAHLSRPNLSAEELSSLSNAADLTVTLLHLCTTAMDVLSFDFEAVKELKAVRSQLMEAIGKYDVPREHKHLVEVCHKLEEFITLKIKTLSDVPMAKTMSRLLTANRHVGVVNNRNNDQELSLLSEKKRRATADVSDGLAAPVRESPLGGGSKDSESVHEFPNPQFSPPATRSGLAAGPRSVMSPMVGASLGHSPQTLSSSSLGTPDGGGPRLAISKVRSQSALRPRSAVAAVSVKDFELLKPISRGAYGKVILVRRRKTRDIFAMKVIPKMDWDRKKQGQAYTEKSIYHSVSSPFIVKIYHTFRSKKNLFFVMDFLCAGDLLQLLLREGPMGEDAVRKYLVEIILALDHLHAQGIVHRDLKPDNFLIDARGHLQLTDFGLSLTGLGAVQAEIRDKGLRAQPGPEGGEAPPPTPGRTPRIRRAGSHEDGEDVVGTPDYLAPEVLRLEGHGEPVDWWAVGVIAFELLTGVPPFNDDTPDAIFSHILAREMWWPEVPEEMSENARDLIDRLLCLNPDQRLGTGGVHEIKEHPFFAGVDWDLDAVLATTMPFIPAPASDLDTGYFDPARANFDLAIESSSDEGEGYDDNYDMKGSTRSRAPPSGVLKGNRSDSLSSSGSDDSSDSRGGGDSRASIMSELSLHKSAGQKSRALSPLPQQRARPRSPESEAHPERDAPQRDAGGGKRIDIETLTERLKSGEMEDFDQSHIANLAARNLIAEPQIGASKEDLRMWARQFRPFGAGASSSGGGAEDDGPGKVSPVKGKKRTPSTDSVESGTGAGAGPHMPPHVSAGSPAQQARWVAMMSASISQTVPVNAPAFSGDFSPGDEWDRLAESCPQIELPSTLGEAGGSSAGPGARGGESGSESAAGVASATPYSLSVIDNDAFSAHGSSNLSNLGRRSSASDTASEGSGRRGRRAAAEHGSGPGPTLRTTTQDRAKAPSPLPRPHSGQNTPLRRDSDEGPMPYATLTPKTTGRSAYTRGTASPLRHESPARISHRDSPLLRPMQSMSALPVHTDRLLGSDEDDDDAGSDHDEVVLEDLASD